MKTEEKQLLLKDLCARLPYEVKGIHRGEVQRLLIMDSFGSYQVNGYDAWFNLDSVEFKPYLRPMSSMTEEESKEFDVITNGEGGFYEDDDGWIRCDNIHTKWGVWPKGCAEMLEWLNAHHFDYRNLIEKDLALEAPDGMYKIE